MKNLLKSFPAVLTLTISIGLLPAAQQPVLRAGVSVEMPVTTNAVPMLDADTGDAQVVAVTRDGKVYLGIERVPPAGLDGKIKSALPAGAARKLYLKADARAQFASVMNVVVAVREAGAATLNLLTSQRDTSETAYPLPPKGLEVRIGPSLPPASESIVVQALRTGEVPALSVNSEPVSFDTLRAALSKFLQAGGRKPVVLKAEGQMPFRDVIRIIDTCRSLKATVFLATPGN